MIGEPALPALIEAAGTPDEGLKEALSAVTAGMGRRGRDTLLDAVRSSPRPRRQVIASVLRRSADVSNDPLDKATLFFAMEDWERLVIHGEPALPVLLSAFSDEDVEIRDRSRDAVVAIGEPSLPLLIPLLGAEDGRAREGARASLLRLAGASTGPLAGLLSGENPVLAGEAEAVLASIGEPAIGPLLALVPTAGPGVIAAVTRVLGSMGEAGIEPLISLLDDPDHGVYAVRALGDMGEAALPGLAGTVMDGGETASRHAALALSRSGTAAVPILAATLATARGEGRDRVRRALVTGGKDYLPGIITWLLENPEEEILSGELVLGVMEVVGDDREGQLSLLGSGCPLLIAASSTLLANLGEEVVPDLTGLLDSDDQLARAGALSTLGAIGAPAVPALTAAVSDPATPARIRTGALAALGTIPGEESWETIARSTRDNDVAVRRVAVRALPVTGPVASVLARALRDRDEEVRQTAAIRLGGLGRPGIAPLMTALDDRDPWVRKAAVAGLAALGMAARYLLSRALHDPDTGVRLEAAKAFLEAGTTPEYSYDAFSYRSVLARERDMPVRG